MKETSSKFVVLFLLLLVSGSKAQLFSLGNCPQVTPLNPAQALLIARTWFEYSRTPSINQHGLRCISEVITFNNGFGIQYTARSKITDTRINLNGQGSFVGGNNVGALSVTFNQNSFPFFRSKSQVYTIIALDGAVNMAGNMVTTPPTFMSLYSCKNVGLARIESSVILTSLRIPAPATVAAARNAFVVRNLPAGNMKEVDQTNC